MRPLLHNSRGETLIEVLASILIAALSVALLFTCVMASSTIDNSAQKADIEHYNALSEADAQITPKPDPEDETAPDSVRTGTVTVKRIDPDSDPTPIPPDSEDMPIVIYGDVGLFSYKRSVETGP